MPFFQRNISPAASGTLNCMRVAVGIVVILLIAFSLLVDYKWKQWVAARKQDRDAQDAHTQGTSDRRS
jgi:hypothetical protein